MSKPLIDYIGLRQEGAGVEVSLRCDTANGRTRIVHQQVLTADEFEAFVEALQISLELVKRDAASVEARLH